ETDVAGGVALASFLSRGSARHAKVNAAAVDADVGFDIAEARDGDLDVFEFLVAIDAGSPPRRARRAAGPHLRQQHEEVARQSRHAGAGRFLGPGGTDGERRLSEG